MPSSEVMHKFATGHLRSGGPSGPVVRNKQQAIAIKISEQQNEQKHGGVYKEARPSKGYGGGPVSRHG